MLDYERLDVYQCALQLAALAFQILEKVPRGHGELSDQLRRATISIPLNIAEGAGKTSERERFLSEEWPLVLERIQRLGLDPAELFDPNRKWSPK